MGDDRSRIDCDYGVCARGENFVAWVALFGRPRTASLHIRKILPRLSCPGVRLPSSQEDSPICAGLSPFPTPKCAFMAHASRSDYSYKITYEGDS